MTFLLGFFLGIWGYFNVGIINLGILELSANREQSNLGTISKIIFLAIVFEILYCFGIVFCLKSILGNDFLRQFLQITTILLLFVLCFIAFQSAQNFLKVKSELADNLPQNLSQNLPKNLIIGIYLAIIIHPQQFSFWGIWGLYFLQNNYITNEFLSILWFALGAGIGAGSFFMLLYFLGKYFLNFIQKNKMYLYYFTSFLMLILGLLECKRFFML